MKSIFTILIVTISAFAVNIHSHFGIKGSGEIVTKEKNSTQNFIKVSSDLSANMVIKSSNHNYIKVQTDKNIIDKITLYIKHNTLFVSANDSIAPTKLNIIIGMVDLQEIRAYGALDIKTKNFKIDNLLLDINGASTLNFYNTKIKTLYIKADGTFNVFFKRDSIAENTYIDADGAGDLILNIKKFLKLKVSGAISIKYSGSPKIEKDIDGVANITKLK